MPRRAPKPIAKPTPAGLMRPVTPSAELAAVIGPKARPRSAVTAAVWDHIRKHGLQDAADKRTIVADDKLRAVFGADRVSMFELPGKLAQHVTAIAA